MINLERTESLQAKPESEPQSTELFSHFRDTVEAKARLNVPESAELILEIVSEIDRQGIENYDVVKTPEVDFPVTVVDVTELFRRILADKVPRREIATAEKPERRTTVFLPGIAPPPVGHPFTLWDYVYQQAYADLPRIIGAWRRGEPLPEIEVRIFGSANSDWGRVTPEWVDKVKTQGFKVHGEQAANYLKTLLPDVDYLRLDGISMGALVALETLDFLTEEERSKMQIMLDNPADHNFRNRLLRVIRALQLPIGFGLDGARIFAINPEYRQLYGGEKGFLQKLNLKLQEKFGYPAPSEDPAQLALKKQVAMAEAVKIAQAGPSNPEERVFSRRGVTDVTTSTFGDVMSLLSIKLQSWRQGRDLNVVRGIGRKLQFAVSAGHQRENFIVDKWAKILNRAQLPGYSN